MAIDCDDTTYQEARLAKVEASIVIYEDAIDSLGSGAVQQYSLDTGQTRQVVTKAQLSQLRGVLDSLENRRATIRARLGCGQLIARPSS